MDLSIGNAFLRVYSGANWSTIELGFATNRNGGLARRESAVSLGFKSEHALEVFSVENPADRFVAPDGTITHGRICVQGDRQYSLSAQEVYTARLFDAATAAAQLHAESEVQQHLSDAAVPAIVISDGATAAA